MYAFIALLYLGTLWRKYPAWDRLAVFWRIFGFLIFIIITSTVIPSENEAVHLTGHQTMHGQVSLLYILYPSCLSPR